MKNIGGSVKDRIEIVDGRKLYLANRSGYFDIGFPIQDILNNPFRIMVEPLEGIFVTVRSGEKIYTWRKTDGWRMHD